MFEASYGIGTIFGQNNSAKLDFVAGIARDLIITM